MIAELTGKYQRRLVLLKALFMGYEIPSGDEVYRYDTENNRLCIKRQRGIYRGGMWVEKPHDVWLGGIPQEIQFVFSVLDQVTDKEFIAISGGMVLTEISRERRG